MKRVRSTSKAAYRKIKLNGLLSQRRFQVYQFLYKYGPATAKQVDVALSKDTTNSGVFTTRLSELRVMGVVDEVGTTVCDVTGYEVILWTVNDSLPTKFVRPKTKTEIIDELETQLVWWKQKAKKFKRKYERAIQ